MNQELLPGAGGGSGGGGGSLRRRSSTRPRLDEQLAAGSSGGAATAAAAAASSNVAGEIEFSGLKQLAKFVKVDSQSSDATLQQLLHKKWELSRPTLVINIFGGDFEKKRQLRMIFKKGLWKAAESAGRDKSNLQGGCWIVTGGFNLGIMKLTGEAVRDYTDAYGGSHMVAIGVPSWGCVARRKVLLDTHNDGPIPYQSEETESSWPTAMAASDEEQRPLDANHTHFFLPDTGTEAKKGLDCEFRTRMSQAVSTWKDDDDKELKVPMCGLLIGGDRFSLEHVFLALTINKCPIVAVKGTAGAADVLATVFDIYFQEEVPSTDKEPDSEEAKQAKLASKITTICQDYFSCTDYFDYTKEVDMLVTIMKDSATLIEVFDMEEDFDLDGKMISSLLSSAGSDSGANQLNLKQLKICLTLNRADIARDKIFLENKKWKKGDLNDYMYQALMEDRHDFVKLFLEQGFSLEDFLTVYILEKLYTDQLKRLNSKVAIFHQLWEYYKSHRSSKKVKLKEVGKVIKVLVGDFYQPLYNKKDFERRLQKAFDSAADESEYGKSAEEDDNHGGFDGIPSGIMGGYSNPMMMEQQQQQQQQEQQSGGDSLADALARKITKAKFGRMVEDFNRDTKAKSVTLERPARELLIWSLLVGKLQMAELFWTMEKEPIAAALLSSMMLKAMVGRTDDFTDKEDFQRGGALFEDHAWGVLDQCYREDEQRAQFLINRELSFYGDSSCIYLAAEGESIKFMAHPCCQDFLTSTWMGKLSAKNGMARFSVGILCGLACPLFIPKIMLFKLTEEEVRAQAERAPSLVSPPSASLVTDAEKGSSSVALELGHVEGEAAQFYPGQENESLAEIEAEAAAAAAAAQENEQSDLSLHKQEPVFDLNQEDMPLIQSSESLNCVQVIQRIRDFYMAPVIRFVYNTFSYLAFLSIFSYLLLFEFTHQIGVLEYVVIAWMITLLLEEIKQATLSGISFSTYISDSWNKLDCIAVGLFVFGFVLRVISVVQETRAFVTLESYTYDVILTDSLFIIARICYAFSLFAFFIRLMYIFSFHIALGPKLIMIGKMVINDLVPFMVILLVFIVGYGVAAHSIAYPTGFYTPSTDYNKTGPEKMSQVDIFIHFLTRAYFQMFGDFGLDTIQAEDLDCKNEGKCPHWAAKWLVPIMLSIYVLLTNILMFNLLIAMFSSTYESINQFSALHWNYQRYSMIKEYIERSPLAPPLIIIWHIYELMFYIQLRYHGKRRSDLEDPLKISYKDNSKKERELIKWEHMKAMDYMRNDQELQQKKGGRGDSKSIIVRTTGPQQQQGMGMFPNSAMDMAKQMSDATSGIGMELEKKFKSVDTQLSKMGGEFDSRLTELTAMLQAFTLNVQRLQENQATIIDRLNKQQQQQQQQQPQPQLRADDPQLQQAIATAVQQVYYAAAPPWFNDASRQAASDALKATPVSVRELGSPLMEKLRPVTQLQPPPPPPPPQAQAARSVSPDLPSEESDEELDDTTIRPQVEDPTTGRIIEHSALDHRLWRYAPFNFEQYPGMRMNVPPDRIPWEIEYRDYFAFDASDEGLVMPTQESHDNPSVPVQSIPFNQYDSSARLRRQSMMGRYRLDSATGAPLNPMGRTGLKGKGLLPHWGPNHGVVIIMTRWSRAPSGAIIHRLGHPILQVVSLFRHKQFCLPWFLTDHLPRCDYDQCVPHLIKGFVSRRLKHLMQRTAAKQEISSVQKGRAEQTFKGYLDDHLNADNAWIEAVVINIHESDDWRFSDAMLKVFAEADCDEQVKWMEVAYSTALRSSHCELLKSVASNHSAYF